MIENVYQLNIKKFELVYATGNDRSCVPAALINPFLEVKGVCVTKRAFDKMNANIQFDNQASNSTVIHGPGKRLQLQTLMKERASLFECFYATNKGILFRSSFCEGC